MPTSARQKVVFFTGIFGEFVPFFALNDSFVNVRTHIKNLQLRSSIFFCFSKRKRWLVRTGPGGTSPRCSRSLLSSEPVSSSSNCKRFAGLQFEARGDFDFPPGAPLNRPEKHLRFFWTFPARPGTAQNFGHVSYGVVGFRRIRTAFFSGKAEKKRPSEAPRLVHFLNIIHIIQRLERLNDLAVLFILFELRAVYRERDGKDAEAGI